MPPPWLSDESLYVPVYATGLSLLVMAIHRVAVRVRRTSAGAPHALESRSHDDGQSKPSSLRDHIAGLGGLTAAALNALRVFSCLALLSMSLYSVTLSQPVSLIGLGLCVTYVSSSPLISSPDDTEGLPGLCSCS